MSIAARLSAYGSTPRILGVDMARGLAMLGMFGAHVGVTGPDVDIANPATYLAVVHGRSAVLFALLAGVSIAILSCRSTPLTGVGLVQARTRIFARAALIFAVGGVLQVLGTNVLVILPVYAALFVVALPFLRWPPRRLFLLAGAIAIVSPVLVLLYTTLSSYVYTGSSVILDLFVTGPYPGIIWIVFVLVGLGIGRLDLSASRVAVRLFAVGLVLTIAGYGLGAAAQVVRPADATAQPIDAPAVVEPPVTVDGADIDLSGSTCDQYSDGATACYPYDYFDESATGDVGSYDPVSPTVDWGALLTIAPHSGSGFEVVGATGFAILVLGVSLLVARRLRWVFYPVIAVGSMALTAYSLHLVVLAFIGQPAYEQPDNWLYLGFVVGALVFCTGWTLLLGRGPFERGLSAVSKRAARVAPEAAPKLDPTEKVD
jgi:uncharacterized membrane protein YeiB